MFNLPKNVMAFYWKYGIKPFFSVLAVWLVLALTWRMTDGIWLPYLEKLFVGAFADNATFNSEHAIIIAGTIVASVVISVLIHVLDDMLWSRLRPQVFNHFSEFLNDYVQNQSVAFWKKRVVGKTSEQITFLAKGFDSLVEFMIVFAQVLVVVFNFGLIFSINSYVALVFGAGVAFYMIYCLSLLKYLRKANKKVARAYSEMMGNIVDSLYNFMLVKLFSASQYEKKFISVSRKNFEISRINAGMITRFFWGVPSIIWALMFGIILFMCIRFYQAGIMTVSDIVFTSTVNVIIMGSISSIVFSLPRIADIVSSAVQSYEELVEPVSVQDAPNAQDLIVKNGEIEFKNVSFAYDDSDSGVLNGVSLKIKSGEKVGLVGSSGAGKTTLVNLIMRLYDTQSGEVLIDGQNIKEVTQASLRKNIAFIPQDTNLFNRTVKENIAYGTEDFIDEDIIKAAKNAAADTFIESLPDSYDTVVGDRGLKLSGGQRQRIAIARAFLKNAPILILDEATSALDSETEIAIQDSFESLTAGRTTIVIAHRLSTLRNMDRIFVLDKGQIVEVGTHKELIKNKDGLYSHLWNMQVDGFVQ